MRAGLLVSPLLVAAIFGACTSTPHPVPSRTASTAAELSDRAAHTATPLPDGSVLVAGGCDVDGCVSATTSSALLMATGWEPTAPLGSPRDAHTATRIDDGRVLVVGGFTGEGAPPLASTETYRPDIRSWTPGPVLRSGRGGHASARLGADRVLVTGGWLGPRTYTASAEILDPQSQRVDPGPDLPEAADGLAAVTLLDGSVLVTGGQQRPGRASRQAVVFARDGRSVSLVGPLAQARFKHVMVPLADGRVLVAGGTSDDAELLDSTEIFDPQTGRFAAGPRLVHGRYKLSEAAALLPDGRVLVAGGGPGLEIVDLVSSTSAAVPGAAGVASFSTVSVVADHAWVVGGYDQNIRLTGLDLRIPLSEL